MLLAAALHDSGKTRDRRDGEHGKNGAKIAEEYLQNNINTISKEDIKIIQIAIEYHTIREEEKGKVNQEFALAVLNSNYKYDNLINNDTVKTLSNVRKRFFEENTITKKERLFPVRIVKKIFEDALFGRTNYKTQGEIKYRNCGRLYIGGTGDMFLCKNKSGMDYIFKPAYRKNTDIYQSYRAEVQVLASKLQERISPQTAVKCEHCEIDGKRGTILQIG